MDLESQRVEKHRILYEVQFYIDILSFIPFVDTITEPVSLTISVATGDKTGATLSIVAIGAASLDTPADAAKLNRTSQLLDVASGAGKIDLPQAVARRTVLEVSRDAQEALLKRAARGARGEAAQALAQVGAHTAEQATQNVVRAGQTGVRAGQAARHATRATEAASATAGPGLRVALGFERDLPELLRRYPDAITYHDWHIVLGTVDANVVRSSTDFRSGVEQFTRAFGQATHHKEVRQIVFSVETMDVAEALAKGFDRAPIPKKVGGNVTDWELVQVLSHPELRNKTVFALPGRKECDFRELLGSVTKERVKAHFYFKSETGHRVFEKQRWTEFLKEFGESLKD